MISVGQPDTIATLWATYSALIVFDVQIREHTL